MICIKISIKISTVLFVNWLFRTSVTDVKFGPKHLGLILATCSADGTVRIYEVIYFGGWMVCLIDTSLLTKYNKLLDMVFFLTFYVPCWIERGPVFIGTALEEHIVINILFEVGEEIIFQCLECDSCHMLWVYHELWVLGTWRSMEDGLYSEVDSIPLSPHKFHTWISAPVEEVLLVLPKQVSPGYA